MTGKNHRGTSAFSQQYIESCFQAWYLAGRPSRTVRIKEVIPSNEFGQKPGSVALNRWIIYGSWDLRADELDARVSQQSDDELIRQKVGILKVQQERASELAKKSHDQMMKENFDSSSAAVQAYFRATEEQRKIAGFSDLLERIEKMKNDELTREIITMLNRASENDQIIEVEGETIPELTGGDEEE